MVAPGGLCSLVIAVEGAPRRDCGYAVCGQSGQWDLSDERCRHAAAGSAYSLPEGELRSALAAVSASIEKELCLSDADFEPGMTVQRGPDWGWGDQDGGTGSVGVVLEREESCPGGHWWQVQWTTSGITNNYRVGCMGKADICPARNAAGGGGRGGGSRGGGRGARQRHRGGGGRGGPSGQAGELFRCERGVATTAPPVGAVRRVPTPERCREICAMLAECWAGQWEGDSCTLKGRPDGSAARVARPAATLCSREPPRGELVADGTSADLPPQQHWPCHKSDSEAGGTPLFRLEGVATPRECAAQCAALPDCATAVHSGPGAGCVLLPASVEAPPRAEGPLTACRRQGGAPPAGRPAARYQCGKDSRFDGGDLFRFTDVADTAACQGYCDRVPDCVAIVLEGGSCTLKAFLTAPTEVPTGLGYEACLRVEAGAGAEAEAGEFDCATGKRFSGKDLLSFSGVAKQAACNALCAGLGECTGTHFSSGGGCQLLRGPGELEIPSGPWVEGAAACRHSRRAAAAAASLPAAAQPETDTEQDKAAARRAAALQFSSVEEESQYYADAKWTKRVLADGRTLYIDDGRGTVSETRPQGFGFSCQRDSHYVGGDLFRLVNVPSVHQCEQTCLEVPQCVAFVHRGACPRGSGTPAAVPDRAKCHTCDIKGDIDDAAVADGKWRLSTACKKEEDAEPSPAVPAEEPPADCTVGKTIGADDLVATQRAVETASECRQLCTLLNICVAAVHKETACQMFQSAEDVQDDAASTLCIVRQQAAPKPLEIVISLELALSQEAFSAIQDEMGTSITEWLNERLPTGAAPLAADSVHLEFASVAPSRKAHALAVAGVRAQLRITPPPGGPSPEALAELGRQAAARSAVRALRLHKPRRYACQSAATFLGGDILRVVGAGGADDCLQRCTRTEGCSRVVFDANGTCQLKSGAAARGPARRGATSCEWEQQPAASAAGFQCEDGKAHIGGDLFAAAGIESEAACRALCMEVSAECDMYVYHSESGLCALKAAGEAAQVEDPQLRARVCTAARESAGYVCQSGSLSGAELFQVGEVDEAMGCEQYCSAVPRCAGFEYRPAARVCDLKDAADRSPRLVSDGGGEPATACTKSSAPPPEDDFQCQAHWAFAGDPVHKVENATLADECLRACSGLSDCAAVSYRDGACLMYAADAESVPDAKAVSCTRRRAEGALRCEDGVSFSGGDLFQIQEVASAAACAAHCKAVPECAAAVYLAGECQLKTGAAKRAGTARSAAVACFRESDPPAAGAAPQQGTATTDYECVQHTAYQGPTLMVVSNAVDVEDCQKHCNLLPECAVAEWRAADGRCRLAQAGAGSTPPTTAGVSTCTRAVGPAPAASRAEAVWTCASGDSPGDELFLLEGIGSLRQCTQQCEAAAACEGLVFRAGSSTCLLKGAAAEDPQPSESDAVSCRRSTRSGELPACTCATEWTSPEGGQCASVQRGCPAQACDGGPQRWCRVAAPGCATEQHGGWTYCTSAMDASAAGSRRARALSGGPAAPARSFETATLTFTSAAGDTSGLTVDSSGVITEVAAGSAAEGAGAKVHMTVTAVNGAAVQPGGARAAIAAASGTVTLEVSYEVCTPGEAQYMEFRDQVSIPHMTADVFRGAAPADPADSEPGPDGFWLYTRVKARLNSALAPTAEQWRAVRQAVRGEMGKADGIFAQLMNPLLSKMGLPAYGPATVGGDEGPPRFHQRATKAKLRLFLKFTGLVSESDNGASIAAAVATLLGVDVDRVQTVGMTKCRRGTNAVPDSCHHLYRCPMSSFVAGCLGDDGVPLEDRLDGLLRGVLLPASGSLPTKRAAAAAAADDLLGAMDNRLALGDLGAGVNVAGRALLELQGQGGSHARAHVQGAQGAEKTQGESADRPRDRASVGLDLQADPGERPRDRSSTNDGDQAGAGHVPDTSSTSERPCFTTWEGGVLLSSEEADWSARVSAFRQHAQDAREALQWYIWGVKQGQQPHTVDRFELLEHVVVDLVLEGCDDCAVVSTPAKAPAPPVPELPPADADTESAPGSRRLLSATPEKGRDQQENSPAASARPDPFRRRDRMRAAERAAAAKAAQSRPAGSRRARQQGPQTEPEPPCVTGPRSADYGLMSDVYNIEPQFFPAEHAAHLSGGAQPLAGVTLEQCIAACESMPRLCFAFSRKGLGTAADAAAGECHLKRAIKPFLGDVAGFDGWGTYTVRCPAEHNSCSWTVLHDVALHAVEEYRTEEPVQDEQTCRAICEAVADCEGVSFRHASKMCFLVHNGEGRAVDHPEFSSFLCARTVADVGGADSADPASCAGAGARCVVGDSTTCFQEEGSYRCGCRVGYTCTGCVSGGAGCTCETPDAPKVCALHTPTPTYQTCDDQGQSAVCFGHDGGACVGSGDNWQCACASGWHCVGSCEDRQRHDCVKDSCADTLLGRAVAAGLSEAVIGLAAQGHPAASCLREALDSAAACRSCDVVLAHLQACDVSQLSSQEAQAVTEAKAQCAPGDPVTLLGAWTQAWITAINIAADRAGSSCGVAPGGIEVLGGSSAGPAAGAGEDAASSSAVAVSIASVPVQRRGVHSLSLRLSRAGVGPLLGESADGISADGLQHLREQLGDHFGVQDVSVDRVCTYLAGTQELQSCYDEAGNELDPRASGDETGLAADADGERGPANQVVVCEREPGNVWRAQEDGPAHRHYSVRCAAGHTIRVHGAFYGRRTCHNSLCFSSSGSNCGIAPDGARVSGGACDATGHCICSADNALEVTRRMCEGRPSCQFTASSAVFGDPCPGENKYMWLNYSCSPVAFRPAPGRASRGCRKAGECDLAVRMSTSVAAVEMMRVLRLPGGEVRQLGPEDDMPVDARVAERQGPVLAEGRGESVVGNSRLAGLMEEHSSPTVGEAMGRALQQKAAQWVRSLAVPGVELASACHDSVHKPAVDCESGFCRPSATQATVVTETTCDGVPACRESFCHGHGRAIGFRGACSCDCAPGYAGERCAACDAGYGGYPACKERSALLRDAAAARTPADSPAPVGAAAGQRPLASAPSPGAARGPARPVATQSFHVLSALPPERLRARRRGLSHALWGALGSLKGAVSVRVVAACPAAACGGASACPRSPVAQWGDELRAQCAALGAFADAATPEPSGAGEAAAEELPGAAMRTVIEFEVAWSGPPNPDAVVAAVAAQSAAPWSPLGEFGVRDAQRAPDGADQPPTRFAHILKRVLGSGPNVPALAVLGAVCCAMGYAAFALLRRLRRRPDSADVLLVRKHPSEPLGIAWESCNRVAAVQGGSAADRCGGRRFVGRRVTHANGRRVGSALEIQQQSRGASELRLLFAPKQAAAQRAEVCFYLRTAPGQEFDRARFLSALTERLGRGELQVDVASVTGDPGAHGGAVVTVAAYGSGTECLAESALLGCIDLAEFARAAGVTSLALRRHTSGGARSTTAPTGCEDSDGSDSEADRGEAPREVWVSAEWCEGALAECAGPYELQRATINDRPVWGLAPEASRLLYCADDGRWCLADRRANFLDRARGAMAWTEHPGGLPWAAEVGGWATRDGEVDVLVTPGGSPPRVHGFHIGERVTCADTVTECGIEVVSSGTPGIVCGHSVAAPDTGVAVRFSDPPRRIDLLPEEVDLASGPLCSVFTADQGWQEAMVVNGDASSVKVRCVGSERTFEWLPRDSPRLRLSSLPLSRWPGGPRAHAPPADLQSPAACASPAGSRSTRASTLRQAGSAAA
eukprot:TRINITY_DN3071_c0_g2_i1.p1 TRINITY_DN3071_c0_g2~~TRINITY_DN3071_c0_g2_i1.p1  ORF type:complete len:4241 (+),score=1053.59 TRINITY_DN3071_c0_g2_i1:1568-12724(+)